MVTICLQCGDEGFSNALVYCIKCLDFALHRYCLDKLPETVDKFVRWVCDDCKLKVPNQSTLHRHSSIPSRKRDHTSSKHFEAIYTRKRWKKKDIACLASEKEENRCQGGPSQQSHKVHTEPDCERIQLTDGFSSLKVKPDDVTRSAAEANDLRCQSSPSQQPSEAYTTSNLTKHVQLPGACSPPKIKLKTEEKDVSCSVAKREEPRLQSSPSKKPHEACTKMDLAEHAQLASDFTPLKIKLKKDVTCSVEEQRHQICSSQKHHEADRKLDLTEHSKLVCECSPPKIKPDKKMKDVTRSVAGTQEQRHQSRRSQNSRMAHTRLDSIMDAVFVGGCSPMINETRRIPLCSEKHKKDLQLEKERRLMLDKESTFENKVSQLATGENHLHVYSGRARPVTDPIWKGNFRILNQNYDLFDGFVAHISRRACPKVCEQASLLPSLLCLEMLPKCDVWPKSFQRSQPSDDNIALYFFPADTRYPFDRLVDDMIIHELAMRAMVKNGELLVFTSIELPLSHRRFQGKPYLWGVFREKQASQSHSVNCRLMVSNRGLDCAVNPDSTNDVGTAEERNLIKTKTWDALSPLSPLSNTGDHERDMDQEI